jgi:hypothetical protein
MRNYALIKNGVVENVVIWDEMEIFLTITLWLI